VQSAQVSLINYLQSGRSVYFEGTEFGYYHAPGHSYYYGLWDYLGTQFVGDGNQASNVSQLTGQGPWYGTAMQFGYPYGQEPDHYVDIFAPAGQGSFKQFIDQSNLGRVVSHVNASPAYRTIVSGVCYCAFSENAPMSTQQRLMDRIVNFLLHDDAVPPAVPGNATAEFSGTTLLLSWNPVTQDTGGNPEAVDSYQVERSTSMTGRWTSLGLTVAPSFTDAPPSLGDPAVNAVYRIRALDTTGNTGPGAYVGEFDFDITHP